MLTVQRFVESNNNRTFVLGTLSDFIADRPLYYFDSMDGGSMFV